MLSTTQVNGQPYVSGVLTTRGMPEGDRAGGFIEFRARMAPGNGMWSALWLNHSSFRNTQESEMDLVEYLGQSRDASGNPVKAAGKSYNTYDTQYHTYWYGARRKQRTPEHYTNSNTTDAPEWCGVAVDFSEAFHVYGVEWTTDNVIYYIDDIEVFRLDGVLPVSNEQMYLVMNVATGGAGTWVGLPDSYAVQEIRNGKVNMIVDWVRVYQ